MFYRDILKQGKERAIEVKQITSQPASQPSSQVSKTPEQQTGKGKVNIPVSHERQP